jgi:hypothetical protein
VITAMLARIAQRFQSKRSQRMFFIKALGRCIGVRSRGSLSKSFENESLNVCRRSSIKLAVPGLLAQRSGWSQLRSYASPWPSSGLYGFRSLNHLEVKPNSAAVASDWEFELEIGC